MVEWLNVGFAYNLVALYSLPSDTIGDGYIKFGGRGVNSENRVLVGH
jgi:hypothetical protein